MIIQPDTLEESYDLVVVGSGFGSLFFVHKYLEKNNNSSRVLIIERGDHKTHIWQIENQSNSTIRPESTFETPKRHKPWNFTMGWGGGTNCWYGQTPRFHPNDFQLLSLYEVGADWPISYDELEVYYAEAERLMDISGSDDMSVLMPRSTPFPQPPHRMTTIDHLMRAAQPDRHFPIATARARVATPSRAACCSTGTCSLCPVDAKFTANNGLSSIITDMRVDVVLNSEVKHLDHQNGTVRSAVFVDKGGREHYARGETFVLGANAIHSPAILLRSGVTSSATGTGINEQVGFGVEVFLDGLDNFDGSTLTTGLNYSLYDGSFRSTHGGTLLYFENRWPYGLRPEFGRWRQILPIVGVVEDLAQATNRVTLNGDGMPFVSHAEHSHYAEKGISAALSNLEAVLAPLPVERIEFRGKRATESHVQGTLRMGTDPNDSVVDQHQIHHQLRNLVVVGSAVFSTCGIANPSLTIAALSLRAAEHLTA